MSLYILIFCGIEKKTNTKFIEAYTKIISLLNQKTTISELYKIYKKIIMDYNFFPRTNIKQTFLKLLYKSKGNLKLTPVIAFISFLLQKRIFYLFLILFRIPFFCSILEGLLFKPSCTQNDFTGYHEYVFINIFNMYI